MWSGCLWDMTNGTSSHWTVEARAFAVLLMLHGRRSRIPNEFTRLNGVTQGHYESHNWANLSIYQNQPSPTTVCPAMLRSCQRASTEWVCEFNQQHRTRVLSWFRQTELTLSTRWCWTSSENTPLVTKQYAASPIIPQGLFLFHLTY